MFTVVIKTSNAPFLDNDGNLDETGWQVRHILKEISEQIENGKMCGMCIDGNGNHVGEWKYE